MAAQRPAMADAENPIGEEREGEGKVEGEGENRRGPEGKGGGGWAGREEWK